MAVVIAAMVIAWWLPLERGVRRIYYGAIIGIAVFLFLQLPPSIPAWERIPLWPLFQFPWRFMGPVALLLAFAGAAAFCVVSFRLSAKQRVVFECLVLALSFANAIPHLMQYQPLTPAAISALPTALSATELKKSYETATVVDENLPIGASGKTPERRPPVDDPILGADPPVLAHVLVNTGGRLEIAVMTDQPSVLHLSRWAFPVWDISVNGVPTPMHSSSLMTLDVPVPAGNSEIVLELRPPRIRLLGLALTACGLLVWMGIAVDARWSDAQ